MQYLQGTPWPDAIDAKGVAEILGKRADNILNHYEELGIPFNRVAGRIIFIESEVRAYKAQREAAKQMAKARTEAMWAAEQAFRQALRGAA